MRVWEPGDCGEKRKSDQRKAGRISGPRCTDNRAGYAAFVVSGVGRKMLQTSVWPGHCQGTPADRSPGRNGGVCFPGRSWDRTGAPLRCEAGPIAGPLHPASCSPGTSDCASREEGKFFACALVSGKTERSQFNPRVGFEYLQVLNYEPEARERTAPSPRRVSHCHSGAHGTAWACARRERQRVCTQLSDAGRDRPAPSLMDEGSHRRSC